MASLPSGISRQPAATESHRTSPLKTGSCHRSFAFRDACKGLGLRHIPTNPSTPQTNGKAERFITTALAEWAYARAFATSEQRAADLPRWLHDYNWHRPHGGINSAPAIQRLGRSKDNLLRMHI